MLEILDVRIALALIITYLFVKVLSEDLKIWRDEKQAARYYKSMIEDEKKRQKDFMEKSS